MAKIAYQMTLTIPGGPQVNVSGNVNGDTYSKTDVEVPAQAGGTPGAKSVSVSAGAADKVVLLAITTDKGSYSEDVEFKLDSGAQDTLHLVAPFVVVGSAAAQLIRTDPNTMVFTNKTAVPVKIEILMARNAVS
ncbi:MAG: hypothetical protein IT159_02235 [Bryobacterales bacterium]|nr:hypothetical protein [Bryobacterales bacterium]